MGQKLKFYARKDLLVNARPGWTPPLGQHIPRVNRSAPIATPVGFAQPALPDPFVCDADSDTGRALLRMLRKSSARKNPPLWPADEATAIECGLPFVRVELVDGEWVPAPSPSLARTKPAPIASKG